MSLSKTASQSLRQYLAKASGAGSRGGHIIGHTRSGKPIYASTSSKYHQTTDFPSEDAHQLKGKVASSFPRYSAQDHRDAMAAHRSAIDKIASNHKDYTDGPGKMAAGQLAQHHHAVNHHYEALHPAG